MLVARAVAACARVARARLPPVRAALRRAGTGLSAQADPLARIRNIGILAHVDAGKTTVTERMLFISGAIKHLGDVDAGNTITDFLEQERERGITIQSAAVTFDWAGATINLIDTPGHVDFTVEVKRCLSALDGVVVVVDSVAGVQAQTKTVWHQADEVSIPRIIFANKMDREGASLTRTVEHIARELRCSPLVLQVPVEGSGASAAVVDVLGESVLSWSSDDGKSMSTVPVAESGPAMQALWQDAFSKLTNATAEHDEELMTAVFDEKPVTPATLRDAVRRATRARAAVPVVCGAAFRNRGIQPLLDAVVDLLPSPLDRAPPVLTTRRGETVSVRASRSDPLCALAFKVVVDPHKGPIVFFRVFSGVLNGKDAIVNSSREVRERPLQLYSLFGKEMRNVSSVEVGGIGGIGGLKHTRTGDTLVAATDKRGLRFAGLQLPQPVFFQTVEAANSADQKTLGDALRLLCLEDPSLKLVEDPDTGDTLLYGMGELHLDVVQRRLRDQFRVTSHFGPLSFSYRESVRGRGVGESEVSWAAGTASVMSSMVIQVEPSDSGNVFEPLDPEEHGWLTVGPSRELDARSAEVVGAIEDGVRQAWDRGPLLGFAVQGCAARLVRASFQASSLPARSIVERCALRATSQALKAADMRLLEPVMLLQVSVPEDAVGKVLSDLTGQRRAHIRGIETDRSAPTGSSIVEAEVPIEALQGYSTVLRSITSGRASFVMEFLHYGPLSSDAQQRVLLERRGYA